MENNKDKLQGDISNPVSNHHPAGINNTAKIISNPGQSGQANQKNVNKGQVKTTKKQKGGNKLIDFSTRLEGFSYSLLSWALGLVLIGFVWFTLSKAGGDIGNYALSTAWFPKFTITIALLIVVMLMVRISLNFKKFKKMLFSSYAVSHLMVIPIIILSLGEVLIYSTTSTADGIWYSGLVFYGIGIVGILTCLGWFIYVVVTVDKFNRHLIKKFNGSYLIPLSAIGFTLYAGPLLVQEASTLLWVFWVATLIFGGGGSIFFIYRHLVIASRDAKTVQNFGYIALPVGLLLLGYANIEEHNGGSPLITNPHAVIFAFVLLGFTSQAMLSTYIVMYKNASLCNKEQKLKYSQSLAHSLVPLALIASATAEFAPATVYNLELAQYTIVQLAFVSILTLYTGTASMIKIINRGFNNPAFLQFNHKCLRAYL